MKNFIFLIIFSLLTKVVFAGSPTDKLGFHWMWDNGCVMNDFYHPLTFHEDVLKNGDKKFPIETYTATKYLSAWEKVFNHIHDSVPHLSPREIDWLNEELKSNNISRNSKARETIEYKQSNMLHMMHMLLSLIKTYNKEKNQEKKKRLLYRFAYRLDFWSLDFHYDLEELKKKGLVEKFPLKWGPTSLWGEENNAQFTRLQWSRASHFIIKCYIVN